jgi:hypothetical protein
MCAGDIGGALQLLLGASFLCLFDILDLLAQLLRVALTKH